MATVDHVCSPDRPCVYCAARHGAAVPSNVYVFPTRDQPPRTPPVMIPLADDTTFQAYLRLPPLAKEIVASLIKHLARHVDG